MNRLMVALGAAIVAAVAASPQAQQANRPHAGYVYPAGGRQGSTVQAVLGGQFLDGAAAVLVTGQGVDGRIVRLDKPMTGREMNDARERLQELQKTARDPASQAELAALRDRLGDSLRRLSNPSLSELLTLEVSIAGDAEPGLHVLRVKTAAAVTEPVLFAVGQLAEFRERDDKSAGTNSEQEITLPAVINGRIIPGDRDRRLFPLRQLPQYMPGDVDRYRFAARKGQQIVVAVSARDLIPYIADAVPGWFQAVVSVSDAQGHEIAYDDDYRFHPDPVLHFTAPADGEYVVQIRDALYRGREDFVYRIAIGELPFVTSTFPLGGRAGTRTKVALTGWNLPSRSITMDGRKKDPGVYALASGRGERWLNAPPFALGDLPEVDEREPNDTGRRAQTLKLPVIVNGRIDRAGDEDVFAFTGRAGEQIVAEVKARRLESALDSELELTDAAGNRVAFNDDSEDRRAWWLTHHADSYLIATLPASGTYYLHLADVQHKGGPEYAYRLRVSAPRPDFELRVAPSAVSIAGTVPITVFVIRRDGFAGDVAVGLKDAPDGFVLTGGLVPAGQDFVRATLTAPARPGVAFTPLCVEGRAIVNGRPVVRDAVPVDDRMQAFAYHHLVPAATPNVLVASRGGARSGMIVGAQPLKIPAGGAAETRVTLPPAYRNFENVAFELTDPPDGIALGGYVVDQLSARIAIKADASKAPAGTRGNLIVVVSGERAVQGAAAARRRQTIGTLPAIPFQIAPAR